MADIRIWCSPGCMRTAPFLLKSPHRHVQLSPITTQSMELLRQLRGIVHPAAPLCNLHSRIIFSKRSCPRLKKKFSRNPCAWLSLANGKNLSFQHVIVLLLSWERHNLDAKQEGHYIIDVSPLIYIRFGSYATVPYRLPRPPWKAVATSMSKVKGFRLYQ